MQLSVHRVGFAGFLVFVLLSTMARAGMPSADELQKHLNSAAQVVDFSQVSGSESPDTAEIRVPPASTVVVRLSCAGGYRGVLISGHTGLAGLQETPNPSLSSEEVLALLEGEPSLPDGIKANQPTAFSPDQGGGVVGGPVPFLSVVELKKPGEYTLIFSIMRVWAPSSATRFALKIHVTE